MGATSVHCVEEATQLTCVCGATIRSWNREWSMATSLQFLPVEEVGGATMEEVKLGTETRDASIELDTEEDSEVDNIGETVDRALPGTISGEDK